MTDAFTERMAAVRQRFVANLGTRIADIELGRDGGFDALELAHRQAHGLCGVGPTLGFVETGKVARSIEQLLLAAVKAQRALTDDEIAGLLDGVARLRSTATSELHG